MGTRFGFVSTYPPTQCGLATFTASLRGALTACGEDEGWIVRLVETAEPRTDSAVVAQMISGQPLSAAATARLNDCDVVVVQHEFGVYGGADGDEILPLLAAIEVPCIVVLHTVLSQPAEHQREVLESVVARADAVVTMSHAARERLTECYTVERSKVSIIPHGAPEIRSSATAVPSPMFRSGQPVVLTWGLLGPGKGIEWGIDAMALLGDLRPAPRYVIAGQTHPKVILRESEAYRSGLGEQVRRLGLAGTVNFDARYRHADALSELVATADVVLLPYDSTDQVTSGVLIEAIAAGKPVVATAFPHAVELLADGAGVVVPHRDPAAIAGALRTVLTRRDVAARMAGVAAASTSQLLWPAIADRYRELAAQLITASIAA